MIMWKDRYPLSNVATVKKKAIAFVTVKIPSANPLIVSVQSSFHKVLKVKILKISLSSVSTVKTADTFKDFIFDAFVSLDESQNKVKVKILRDTGAALSLLHYATIPNINDKLTGEKVNIKDLTGASSVPLANIFLDCSIVKGNVKVGVNYKELPVEGIHMLLGNDLAGKLVVPN